MSKLLVSLVAVLVAAIAVAGCGGQKVTADEVPGAPVALQIPEVTKGGSDALAGKSSSSSSSSQSSQDSADAEATATPTPAAGGSTGTSGTTQSGSTGGTSGTSGTTQQQTQTQQGNGTNGQSQSGGGNTFDDFCKNNPGAC
jgi:hypothetical protein